MQLLRKLLLCLLTGIVWQTGPAQPAGWKSTKLGKIAFRYPPDWVMERQHQAEGSAVTLTPDSMKHLSSMRMMAFMEAHLPAGVSYADFARNFGVMLTAQSHGEIKVEKVVQSSFKGHPAVCADILQSSLPGKVYGIDCGTLIYMVVMTRSRHVNVRDRRMEEDEMTMLNSMVISP